VVELRFFGGLNLEETAQVLKVSSDTVLRDWTMAKSWLRCELSTERLDGAWTLAGNRAFVLCRSAWGKEREGCLLERAFGGNEALRRPILGPEYHDTLKTMGDLAVDLHAQGRLAESEKLFREVLEIERRIARNGIQAPTPAFSRLLMFQRGPSPVFLFRNPLGTLARYSTLDWPAQFL
jgi:hypothetical protein